MRVPIPLQTVYAELVEQAAVRDIDRDFPAYGGFAHKTVKGKRYVYWQGQVHGVRRQKFVGPDEPATWARIDRAKRVSEADDTRTRMVDALRMPASRASRPQPATFCAHSRMPARFGAVAP